MAVDDQVERDALGVALFGTMWEDLGTEAMEAMAGSSQAAYDTEGALEKINQVKYNDLDSAIQGIGRQMEVALLPAADAVYQSLMDSMPEITEAMEEVSPVIAEIAGTLPTGLAGPFRTACRSWWTGSATLQTGRARHTKRPSRSCPSCGSIRGRCWPWRRPCGCWGRPSAP